MVKITSERRRKVRESTKTYASVEELLEDWDGTCNKIHQLGGKQGEDFVYTTYIYSWGNVESMRYSRRHEDKGLDIAPEVIRKYVRENAEEIMALFYLNSEVSMQLQMQIAENIKFIIVGYHNKNYALWIEEQGSV